MNCVQFAWGLSSRAPKTQTAHTLLCVGQEKETFSPSKATGADSLPREAAAPARCPWTGRTLHLSPRGPMLTLEPQGQALLCRQGRDKRTSITFNMSHYTEDRGTEPTSPGGFKLKPGAMKHPGECVQLAIRLPERQRVRTAGKHPLEILKRGPGTAAPGCVHG